MDIWKELRDEGVDSGLLDEVRRFREAHPLTPEAQERVPVPKYCSRRQRPEDHRLLRQREDPVR